jgi:CRP-like cAMP-binding protein
MSDIENIISRHPFAIGLRPEHLTELAKGAEEYTFAAGDVIFHEGDSANRLYLILSGEVALEAGVEGKAFSLQELRGGSVLGWSWLFPPFAWHFTARATAPTRVIACNGGHLLVACEENPVFGYELMRRVAQVAIHRLEAGRRNVRIDPEPAATAV